MKSFAKIFDLPTHQVLFFKDSQEVDDEPMYRIEARTEHDGALQSCFYGYRDEAKRDAKFEALDEQIAQVALSLLLAAFIDPFPGHAVL